MLLTSKNAYKPPQGYPPTLENSKFQKKVASWQLPRRFAWTQLFNLRMEQTIELDAVRRCELQVIRAVGCGPKAVRRPAPRCGKRAVLLQSPARHILPIDRDCIG